jgi:hypothetical protein
MVAGVRRMRRLALAAAAIAALALAPAASASWTNGTGTCERSGDLIICTYTTTGASTFTVPFGVTSVDVVATGGAGGSEVGPSLGLVAFKLGGLGGVVTAADFAVTPRAAIPLYVGARGLDEQLNVTVPYSLGGSGGDSTQFAVDDATRFIIAGGGGGAGAQTLDSEPRTGGDGGGDGVAGGSPGVEVLSGIGGAGGLGGAGAVLAELANRGGDGGSGKGGLGGGSYNGAWISRGVFGETPFNGHTGEPMGDGRGGDGVNGAGGGGGGYGGGAGGSYAPTSYSSGRSPHEIGAGGGGSHGPPGATYSLAAGPNLNGSIVITYDRPTSGVRIGSAKPSPYVGDRYTPSVTGPDDAPAVLSLAPASASICTLKSGTVTFAGAGRCTLRVDQEATDQHGASHLEQAITVRAVPAIALTAKRSGTTISVSFTTVRGGEATLTATADIRTVKRRTKRIPACAKATAKIPGARTTTLTCDLDAAVKAARPRGRVTVRLTVVYTPTRAPTQTATATVVVPKRK